MLKRLKQLTLGGLALAALGLGGSALAGAATGSGTSTTSTTPPSSGEGAPPGVTPADRPGTAAHEDAEKPVTGDAATKAKAAAIASTGGGTAGAVTENFRHDGGYEVEVTKTDGSKLTVHLDSAFKVQSHPGGPGGAPRNGNGPAPQGSQAPTGAEQAYGQEPSAA